MTQVKQLAVNVGAINELAARYGWVKPFVRKSNLTRGMRAHAVELNSRFVATAKGIMPIADFLQGWKCAGAKWLENQPCVVGHVVNLPMDWVEVTVDSQDLYYRYEADDAGGVWVLRSSAQHVRMDSLNLPGLSRKYGVLLEVRTAEEMEAAKAAFTRLW